MRYNYYISIFFALKHVYGINVCYTTVWIDKIALKFHTEYLHEVDKVANAFCSQHNVNYEECDRIKKHHKLRCFQQPGEEAGADMVRSDAHRKVEDEDIKISEAALEVAEVDYSQKVGPILEVTDIGNGQDRLAFKCQSFAGETIARTCKRCCVTLSLSEENCKLLSLEYEKLINRAERSNEAFNDITTNDPAPEETRSPIDLIVYYVYGLNDFIALYWNWILLLVSCFYVYFNN
jgi:hypothetical protein